MKKAIIITFIILCHCVWTQTIWTVSTYSVVFKVKHAFGAVAEGRLSNLNYSINFAPDQLSQSKISASVASNTFNTGNNSRDINIKSDKYLDVIKYPLIEIKSIKFVANNDEYLGYFELTIKDVTKQIIIPFVFLQNGNTATFKGSFKINRLDYKIGLPSVFLDNIVDVKIVIDVKR